VLRAMESAPDVRVGLENRSRSCAENVDRQTPTWNVGEAREYGHRLDGETEKENPWETLNKRRFADRHDCAQ
jgi:hypothetical protein